MRIKPALALSLVVVLSAACSVITPSSRPQLYPNAHVNRVGFTKAERDVDDCMALANQYVQQPSRWKSALTGSAKGAVVGTAAGALGGTVFSKAGRGAGAGAAMGGVLGLANELDKMGEHDPSYQRFTEHCLHKRGYEIVGWR
jgi:uncharacterized protein YcfJ